MSLPPEVPETDVPSSERPGLLTRRDIFSSWWRWLFFSHANYNWERLQGTGFAHAMTPVIDKLYTTKEDRAAALKRHSLFFNTEPDTGGVIHGMTIAMEERRAAGADIDDETINRVKIGLMGPFAGLGDTLQQGMWFPVWQSIGIGIAVGAAGAVTGIAGPLLYMGMIILYVWFLGWYLYYQGYVRGQGLVSDILGGGLLERVRTGAGVLGAAVLGALGAQFVTVRTGVRWTVTTGTGEDAVVEEFSLQGDLFDALFPGFLPLLALITLIWLLRRGTRIVNVILYIFGITLAASLVESVSRYAIREDQIFGVFSPGGTPTLIGMGVLVVATYLIAVRKDRMMAGHVFVGSFLVVAFLGAVFGLGTGIPFQLLFHF
jgi:mannose PTS system EIID component